MKKVFQIIRISVITGTNLIWAFYSAPCMYLAFGGIFGTINGDAYEIREPDKGLYIYIGCVILVIYLIVSAGLQYGLYRFSKLKLLRYMLSFFIPVLIGFTAGYIYYR